MLSIPPIFLLHLWFSPCFILVIFRLWWSWLRDQFIILVTRTLVTMVTSQNSRVVEHKHIRDMRGLTSETGPEWCMLETQCAKCLLIKQTLSEPDWTWHKPTESSSPNGSVLLIPYNDSVLGQTSHGGPAPLQQVTANDQSMRSCKQRSVQLIAFVSLLYAHLEMIRRIQPRY